MELDEQNLSNNNLNDNHETERNISRANQYKKNMDCLEFLESFLEMIKKGGKYSDRNKIKDLIKLITELPKEDEFNIGYRFPSLGFDILIDVNKRIQDMIFLSEEEFNNKYTNIEKENKNIEKVNETKNDFNNKIIDKTEINQLDEGPDGKKEKIVNEKKDEKIEKKEIKEKRKFNIDKHNDILDTLFDFTKNENSLSNDVLCGYFHRLISFLMKNYLIDIFLYLFLIRKDALEQIVMHSYNRSLALVSIELLNIEDNIHKLEENIKINPGFIDMKFLLEQKYSIKNYRNDLLDKVIKSIDLDGMKDKSGKYLKNIDVENILFMFIELIKTSFFYDDYLNKIMNEHIFKILEKNPSNEQQKKIYNYFIILLTQILNKSTSAYQKEGKIYPEFDYGKIFENIKGNYYFNLQELVVIYIPKILATNFIESSKENSLGIHIIHLMDLYFFKYQLNNIYQSKFVIFFTQNLEEAINHPLLTDFIFNKIKFPFILAYFINKQPFKENNMNKYINQYKYKTGKTMLSCVNAYVIDLLFKIKVACEISLLDEKKEVEIYLPNYNLFSFLKDETSTKKGIQFKLPKYICESLFKDVEWCNIVNKCVLPKIKMFEGKLLCKEPIKPKPNNSNDVKSGQNILNNDIADKNKIMKKEEESLNNFNDIYFWKMKDAISCEIKEKDKLKRNTNKNESNDEEDELLMIAMELEKQEK